MKSYQLLLILTGLMTTGFSVQAQHIDDPSLVAKGARLYSENCGRCHNPRPASEYSKREWSVVMPHMREKAHMTGEESLAVEAFLASTLTAEIVNKPIAADTPQRSGKELIAQFGCQGCHQIKGVGGKLGPSLDGVVKDKGQEFLLKKLKNPKFNNASTAMPRYPMTDAEMQAILDYLDDQ